MRDVFVDPCVLACPTSAAASDEIDRFVEQLLSLRDLRDKKEIRTFILSDTMQVLESTRSYPVGIRLERFTHQQRSDVSKIVHGLLAAETIEARTGVEDLIVEDPQCTPSSQLANRLSGFVDSYYRLHAMLSIANQGRAGDIEDPCVITRGLPSESALVLVEGTIPMCVRTNSACDSPGTYSVSVRNVEGIGGLLTRLDPVEIWRNGACDWALRIAMFQRSGSLPAEEECNWRFGKQFTATAAQYGFVHERSKIRRVMSACIDTIVDTNLRAVHQLRTGSGGNDPQVVRSKDGATAWRRDIDDEFHLHYWRVATMVEFASLCPHNDFAIPN